jgi:hypothetical protein
VSNHYDILGVWRDSPADEIEQRYQAVRDRLVGQEKDDETAALKLRAIDEARAVLIDPVQRAMYDDSLKNPMPAHTDTIEDHEPASPSPAESSLLNALPEKTRKHLEPQLHDGEEVIAVINGASAQAIVALQTRLFIVKPGLMAGATFGARVTSFDYRNITAIEVNKKLVTAVIEVIAAGYQGVRATSFWSTKDGQDAYKISNCLPLARAEADKAEPVLALIRERIAQLHSPTQQAGSTSVADELAKLAELHRQGILSVEEFDAAKRRLLTS